MSSLIDVVYIVEQPGGVSRYRAVVRTQKDNGCAYPQGPGVRVLGIATHAQSREQRAVTVRRLGIAMCELAAPVARDESVVVADAQGRLGPATLTGTAVEAVVGFADATGAAGDVIPVFLTPGAVGVPSRNLGHASETATSATELSDVGVCVEIKAELDRARAKFGPMASAHEGFAVLMEELDELWQHVKTKQSERDVPAMRKEAIQIGAMAARFANDVCDVQGGRK